MHDVVIIGTGPAGLTAAIYTARAGLKPVLFAGLQHGGQLTTTTEVENFPGFKEPVMGPQLMTEMTAQAERVGATLEYEEITQVDFSNPGNLKLWADKKEISAKSVIIATGATAKTLGLDREAELMGKGLSTCATCDGFFFKGKKVMVIGGGDSAMEEAGYLSNLCSEVILCHRRDGFRASKIMLERAQKNEKIKFMVPYQVKSLLEDDNASLVGVELVHSETGETQKVELDGLFYGIGHRPNSSIFKDFVDLDDHGYILVKDHVATKTPGVFAAGDIADSVFRQAVTAAGMGCQAAISAARYLEELH